MKKISIHYLALISLIFCTSILANDDSAILIIDKIVTEACKIQNQPTTNKVILGTYDQKSWKICKNTNNDYDVIAYLYFVGKRLSSARFIHRTDSGDYGFDVLYCFDENQKLIYIYNDGYSFYGASVFVKDKIYFDQDCKIIKEDEKYISVESKKEIKKTELLFSFDPTIYKNATEMLDMFKKGLKGVVPPWTTFK